MPDMSRKTTNEPASDALEENLKDSLRVGLGSGGVGFLIGGTAGILKNTTPFLFAVASFIQCGTLGSTFWLSRAEVLRAWDQPHPSSSTLTQASAIAGAASGGFAALIYRGPKNIIPGILCMTAFGAAGQAAYNRYSREASQPKQPSIWQSFTNAKWSPMQSITDEDYAKLLREKLLKNQVEVSILDDKIAALKDEISATEKHKSKQDGN